MNKVKKFFNGRLFYSLALGVLVAAVAATGAMFIGGNQSETGESPYLSMDESASQVVIGNTEATDPELVVPGEEIANETEAVDAVPETTEANVTEEAETTAVAAKQEETETAHPVDMSIGTSENLFFSEENKLSWPVEGEVIRDFSMEATVYYSTLNAYKVSPAILIQGEVGTEVKAAAEGVVKLINYNEELGNYLVVELGDGYEATYGQLTEIAVNAGDYVQAGDKLAQLGEPTIYYCVEGPNLYFQLTKDAVAVDPLDYIR